MSLTHIWSIFAFFFFLPVVRLLKKASSSALGKAVCLFPFGNLYQIPHPPADSGTHQSIAVRGGKPSIISQEMPPVLPQMPRIQTTCVGLFPTREIHNNGVWHST